MFPDGLATAGSHLETELRSQLTQVALGMRIAQAGPQLQRLFALRLFDGKTEDSTDVKDPHHALEDRRQLADVDEDVRRKHEVMPARGSPQVFDKIGLHQLVLDARRRRVGDQVGGQVDALEPRRHRPDKRAAKPSAAAQIQSRGKPALRQTQSVDQYPRCAVAKHLDQMLVELAGIGVEQTLHILPRRRAPAHSRTL